MLKKIAYATAGAMLIAAPIAVPLVSADGGTSSTAGTVIVHERNDMSNLGSLFVLDRLFGGGTSVLSGGNRTNLGDLFILDQLFGNGSILGNDGIIGNGMGIGTSNSLGDLFVLDRLFGGHSILGGNRTNLGDLFILDQLFSR